jgi:hypothetical protein
LLRRSILGTDAAVVAQLPHRRVVGEEHLDAVLARAPSFLPVLLAPAPAVLRALPAAAAGPRPLRLGFLISPSVDGELGAMIVRRAGGHVIRGSSSHTGAQALKAYFEALMRERVSPIINPDGPRGPRFKFKPGAILLAQMSGRPMLPLAYAASRAGWCTGTLRAAAAVRAHRDRDRRAARRSRACSMPPGTGRAAGRDGALPARHLRRARTGGAGPELRSNRDARDFGSILDVGQ